jgi:hypothetical protein
LHVDCQDTYNPIGLLISADPAQLAQMLDHPIERQLSNWKVGRAFLAIANWVHACTHPKGRSVVLIAKDTAQERKNQWDLSLGSST